MIDIKNKIEEYIKYGIENYFESIVSQKVREKLDLSLDEAKIIEQSDEYKNLKETIDKFKGEREFGFDNEAKFEKWVDEAKKHEKWGFAVDEKLLHEKFENKDFGFGDFDDFEKWYEKEPKKCCYCGISQDELKKLFKEKGESEDKKRKKPLFSKKRGFSAALQVEKLNPNKPYTPSNCALVCAFCNNAKSDMVSEANFRKYFAKAISDFLHDILNALEKGENPNEMPYFEDLDGLFYQKKT